jgi:peptidyl-prolyl cis-trans isomerase D
MARASHMLDLFRKRGLSSVIYGAIIFATVLVFVIQFRPNAGQKTASLREQCVATVRGWCVDPKDYKAAYYLLMPRDQSGARSAKKAQQMGVPRAAIDGLVERELLVNEADRLGLKVSDDEVSSQILDGWIRVSLPSDNWQLANQLGVRDGMVYAGFKDPKTKQFDMKIYERQLRMIVGRSPNEFREEQTREALAAKVRELVTAPVRVSDEEAFQLYSDAKSSATVTYVAIKQSWVDRWAVKVTPGDVDKWLADKANAELVDTTAKGREEEDTPKENHIRHILVRLPPNASEDDVRAAAQKLGDAKARVDAGGSFAEIARDLSDDKGSAAKGGDVGDKTDGFVGPFKDAANALKAGEMTKTAIQTQFGLHLIMKDDPSKADAAKAAAKKEIARSLYAKSVGLDKTRDLAAKVLAAVNGGKSADDAVKELVASMPKPAAQAAPIEVTREKKPELDAGAADATTTTTTSATVAKSEPVKVVGPDTDPNRPEVVTSQPVNQGGDPVTGLSSDDERKVTAFAFDPATKDGQWMKDPIRMGGGPSGGGDDGYVVAGLKDRTIVTKADFEKEKETFEDNMLAAKRVEALALYVKRLRDAAKDAIKIDERFIDEQKGDGGTTTDEDEEGP